MNNTHSGIRPWQMIVFLLMALFAGVLIGVAGVRYGNRLSQAISKSKGESASVQSPGVDWPALANNNHWDPFHEMRRIRAEMDRLFAQSIGRLQADSQLPSFAEEAGYSSSLDVRDLKDHYEIHAYLPDSNVAEAQVKLEGNQLKVEVTNKTTNAEKNKNGETRITEWGQYDQVVQLPGRVEGGRLKVERKGHELLITVPKLS